MVLYFLEVDDSRLRAARAVVRIRTEMRKSQPTSTGVHVDAVMGSVPPRAGVNGIKRKKRKKVKEVAAMGKGRGGLGEWFEEKWVDISRPKEGGGFEPCGRDDAKSGKYPKCVPSSKAAAMSEKERKSAVRRKRKAEAEATRVDKKPVNVATDAQKAKGPCWDGYRQEGTKTGKNGDQVPNCVPNTKKKKSVRKESRNVPTDKALYARVKAEAKKKFDVYPSAYANAWLVREYKSRGGGYRVEKASFASRSEAGRYAAQQRWKGNTPKNKVGSKLPELKIVEVRGDETFKRKDGFLTRRATLKVLDDKGKEFTVDVRAVGEKGDQFITVEAKRGKKEIGYLWASNDKTGEYGQKGKIAIGQVDVIASERRKGIATYLMRLGKRYNIDSQPIYHSTILTTEGAAFARNTEIEKASFASRSEAGRYAAEQRWKNHVKVQSERADAKASIIETVRREEGMSVKIDSGLQPTNGYMVARKEHSKIVSAEDFFDATKGRKILGDFLKANRERFGKDQYLGLWHDTKTGKVYLDITDNIQDRKKAEDLGRERNQISIWDVVNKVVIETGGTGEG